MPPWPFAPWHRAHRLAKTAAPGELLAAGVALCDSGCLASSRNTNTTNPATAIPSTMVTTRFSTGSHAGERHVLEEPQRARGPEHGDGEERRRPGSRQQPLG